MPDRTTTDLAATLAVCAGTGVLAAGFFIFVLALKPFAYGIWFQAEPVTVGLLVLGAAAAACLIALAQTGHPVAEVLVRPPVRILAAFVAWNAICSLFQSFPARSWFGSPEIGEGIFAYLALLALLVLTMVLWPLALPRRIIAGAAVASAVAIGVMDAALPLGSPWRPEMFASYAGSIGPSVVLIAAAALGRLDWRRLGLAVLAGLPIVVFSQNKTAIVLYCLVGPLVFLATFPLRWRVGEIRLRQILTLGPLAAVAVSGVVVLVPLAFGWWDPLYSLRSRSLLILAALKALVTAPGSLLWGFGWGSFNDLLYRNTFIWGVRGYRNGVWNPDWEGIGAGSFHTHYDLLEAVLGAGLIGGALYVLLFCVLVRSARRDLLALGGVAWLLQVGCASFWFPFMLSFPFLAAAMAASVTPIAVAPAHPVRRVDLGSRLAMGLAVAVLGWGAWATARDALAGGRLLAALNRQDPAEVATEGKVPPDHGRGGVHLWWAALNYADFIDRQMAAGHKPTYAQGLWYIRLLDEVDAWTAQGRAGIRLAALTVAMRNDIVADQADTVLADLRTRELARWGDTVLRVLRLAPDRTDIAVSYLGWLASGKHYVPILAMCEQMALLHPRERVCLWFGGFAMLSDPMTEAAGLRAMHEALGLDVEAVVPVAPDIRAAVEANFPSGGR